ncbi:proline and serine-rich protein 2-like [Carassius carassius]|uniref:proline and serine-rich protein 2-like n=1 Tax=Carassius carassius TaxID=217509 RepID=UPI0028686D69|nr:proline and serine-rich protein 2-like [Carassius carassius]
MFESASGDLRHKQDDDLQFLSLEEQECIFFFEEIICSLEEEDERMDPCSYTTAPHPSAVDQDIIDLVHATPDRSKPRDTLPFMPDSQELIIPPERHFEAKAKRDVDVSQEHFRHLPLAGSVPTPVVIASRISEHQGASGTSASQLLECRRSLESTRHGPPTHAKPSGLPDRISVVLGSRHSIDGREPPSVRKPPTRSISFQDPTPEKSRMEALSKLGLAQRRTQSIMHSKSAGNTLNITNPADRCQTKSSHAVTHSDFNSFGGKSITFNPALSDFHHNNFSSRSRVVTPNHETPIKEDASSSDRTSDEGLPRRKASRSEALVKPSFRAQGVTVQFSGRGASDEARCDALHKLGLLCSHTPH